MLMAGNLPRLLPATPLRTISRIYRRQFSSSQHVDSSLRIGFVPEHFSTPLHFAHKHHKLDASLIPFPSGTGHMVTSLQAGEIDIGIGLTEGWVAALGKHQNQHHHKHKSHTHPPTPGFQLVGTYVETPLCWSISTGHNRTDLQSVEDLKGKRVGVSRIGSGSYVMSYVLADKYGWLHPYPNPDPIDFPVGDREPPFPVEVCNTFLNLREGVNKGRIDFFMWEYFTSKRYYDSSEIRKIGEIYTPWSSWKIVASNSLLHPSNWVHGEHAAKRSPFKEELEDALLKINLGIKHFEREQEKAVRYISTKLDYSEQDAREWLKTVRFAQDVRGVDRSVVQDCVGILEKAGVLDGRGLDVAGMVALERSEAVKSV